MDTSLQQRIQSADLTRTEKRIADYFLDHSESLYFMTARDIAQELGNPKTANIVALGYIAKLLPMIPYDLVAEQVERSFARKPKLIPINLEALKKGYEL